MTVFILMLLTFTSYAAIDCTATGYSSQTAPYIVLNCSGFPIPTRAYITSVSVSNNASDIDNSHMLSWYASLSGGDIAGKMVKVINVPSGGFLAGYYTVKISGVHYHNNIGLGAWVLKNGTGAESVCWNGVFSSGFASSTGHCGSGPVVDHAGGSIPFGGIGTGIYSLSEDAPGQTQPTTLTMYLENNGTGYWNPILPGSNYCTGTPETQCYGVDLQNCNLTSNTWYTVQACFAGCGAPITGCGSQGNTSSTCTNGEFSCVGADFGVCNAGTWSLSQSCSVLCNAPCYTQPAGNFTITSQKDVYNSVTMFGINNNEIQRADTGAYNMSQTNNITAVIFKVKDWYSGRDYAPQLALGDFSAAVAGGTGAACSGSLAPAAGANYPSYVLVGNVNCSLIGTNTTGVAYIQVLANTSYGQVSGLYSINLHKGNMILSNYNFYVTNANQSFSFVGHLYDADTNVEISAPSDCGFNSVLIGTQGINSSIVSVNTTSDNGNCDYSSVVFGNADTKMYCMPSALQGTGSAYNNAFFGISNITCSNAVNTKYNNYSASLYLGVPISSNSVVSSFSCSADENFVLIDGINTNIVPVTCAMTISGTYPSPLPAVYVYNNVNDAATFETNALSNLWASSQSYSKMAYAGSVGGVVIYKGNMQLHNAAWQTMNFNTGYYSIKNAVLDFGNYSHVFGMLTGNVIVTPVGSMQIGNAAFASSTYSSSDTLDCSVLFIDKYAQFVSAKAILNGAGRQFEFTQAGSGADYTMTSTATSNGTILRLVVPNFGGCSGAMINNSCNASVNDYNFGFGTNPITATCAFVVYDKAGTGFSSGGGQATYTNRLTTPISQAAGALNPDTFVRGFIGWVFLSVENLIMTIAVILGIIIMMPVIVMALAPDFKLFGKGGN